jgi:hypothetical protein
MSDPGPEPGCCPYCWAENHRSDATNCWRCDRPIERPEATRPPPAARPRFGLGALMMLIALIAVCLGLMREAPGLLVLLAVTVAPALVWTLVVTSRTKAEEGRPMSLPETMGVFILALLAVVIIWVSSLIAFVATCLPIGFVTFDLGRGGGLGVVLAFGIGGVAAVAAGYGTYRLLRRLRP